MAKIVVASLGLATRKNKNNEIEYLLTQRYSPNNSKFHHKWQLPGGGLEFGETPEECVIREMKEELDVTAKIIYQQPIVLTNIWIGGDDDTDEDVQIILIGYLIDIGQQLITITDPDEETADFAWFTYQQVMQSNALPQTKEFVMQGRKLLANK